MDVTLEGISQDFDEKSDKVNHSGIEPTNHGEYHKDENHPIDESGKKDTMEFVNGPYEKNNEPHLMENMLVIEPVHFRKFTKIIQEENNSKKEIRDDKVHNGNKNDSDYQSRKEDMTKFSCYYLNIVNHATART